MQHNHRTASALAGTVARAIVNGEPGGTLAVTPDGTVVDAFSSVHAEPGRFVVGGVSEHVATVPAAAPFNSAAGTVLRAYRDHWAEHGGLVGYWLNTESGNYEVELCETYNNKNLALTVAQKRGEKAIYDRILDREIAVKDRSEWVHRSSALQ